MHVLRIGVNSKFVSNQTAFNWPAIGLDKNSNLSHAGSSLLSITHACNVCMYVSNRYVRRGSRSLYLIRFEVFYLMRLWKPLLNTLTIARALLST